MLHQIVPLYFSYSFTSLNNLTRVARGMARINAVKKYVCFSEQKTFLTSAELSFAMSAHEPILNQQLWIFFKFARSECFKSRFLNKLKITFEEMLFKCFIR